MKMTDEKAFAEFQKPHYEEIFGKDSIVGMIKDAYYNLPNEYPEIFKKAEESPFAETIEKQVNDAVNRPSHYTTGEIEVIDYIVDKLTPEQLEGYCIGNSIKYISRYRHKNGVEDLKKAVWYLNYWIEKAHS